MRISGISFLNAAPLVEPLKADLPPDCELRLALPSHSAEHLRAGAADLALVPVAAYATIPDLLIVPDIGVGARGPVRSILLISKVPIEEIRTLAADQASRSSVALCRVLFRKFYGGPRQVVSMKPELRLMLHRSDSALIIGDAALKEQIPAGLHVYDVAELWSRFTGLPFVFAVWAVRQSCLPEFESKAMAARLTKARDAGVSRIADIAAAWEPRLKLDKDQLRSYLENLHYSLTDDHLAGLQLFLRFAGECGLLPEGTALNFTRAGLTNAGAGTRA